MDSPSDLTYSASPARVRRKLGVRGRIIGMVLAVGTLLAAALVVGVLGLDSARTSSNHAAAGGRVRSSLDEVLAVAEASSASAEEVSASTEETSAATQRIAASATDLNQTAGQLQSLLSQFTLPAE